MYLLERVYTMTTFCLLLLFLLLCGFLANMKCWLYTCALTTIEDNSFAADSICWSPEKRGVGLLTVFSFVCCICCICTGRPKKNCALWFLDNKLLQQQDSTSPTIFGIRNSKYKYHNPCKYKCNYNQKYKKIYNARYGWWRVGIAIFISAHMHWRYFWLFWGTYNF